MSVYQNIKDVWTAIYFVGVSKKDVRHSISDVARICEMEWSTARNCLEFLLWANLADEKKVIDGGKYKRMFKGRKRDQEAK